MLRNRSLLRSRICCLMPAVALAFGAASSALAATPDAGQAGQIVNQLAGQVADSVRQKQPSDQPQNNVSIEVNRQQQETSEPSTGPKIKVNGFHITGQNSFSEGKLQAMIKDTVGRELTKDELKDVARQIAQCLRNQGLTGQNMIHEDKVQALLKDAVGKELTLGELKDIAKQVAQYYRDQGFVVANAYIPEQKIKDGIVEIAVVPGKYGEIVIRNHSKLSDDAVTKFLSGIKSGDFMKKSQLERTLLLLSDTGGISIKATLAQGKDMGTADLIVDINDSKVLTGNLSANNYGNRQTGQNQSNLTFDLNDIGRRGDVLNIGYGYSGSGMNNVSMSYMIPNGSQGWRLGANYSRLHYTLGGDYSPLLAHGVAETVGVYGQYPIVRSRDYDLYAQIGVATRRLVDDIDLFDSSNQRRADYVTFGLNGTSRDSRSVNSFALNVESGRLNFTGGQDAYGVSWQSVDEQGANTGGSYTKANFVFNRLQQLNNRLNLYLMFNGQLASKDLDSSEELYLGGANGVRAYGQGEAPGDDGYLFTGELRYNLPTLKFQLAAFIDSGHVDGSKSGWSGGNSSHTLSGAGLGLIFNRWKEYNVRVDYAWKLSSSADTTETTDRHGRWWLTGVRYF